jgi:class 3 adenylate cyclase
MTETRKLAAILAADVVGYSRLAATDEDRTLARLRALRSDLIDPSVAVHNCRVVKRTGDGSLIEFRSVVDAVRCAIEVQTGMVERNAGLPPERSIEFRVGIHLGDVVEESDGDLMGDGVNIAARLEGIAKPGTICLSEDAYRQVRARLDLAVSDLGEKQLKNIAVPVRVYSLEIGKPTQAQVPATVPVLVPLRRHFGLGRLMVRNGLLFEDQAVESAFFESFRNRFYVIGRTSMIFGLVAWVVFGASDLLSGVSGLRSLQFRFMLAMPLMLLLFGLSFTQFAWRHWQAFLAAFAVIGIVCVHVGLLLVGPESWFRVEQATMSFMLFIALVGFAPFTFIYAVGVGLLIIALHAAYMISRPDFSAVHALFYSLFVAGSYVIICAAAWVREQSLRSSFATKGH